MQRNSKYRLCGDRAETIDNIVSECGKLEQKEYKTRDGCVGKVIYLESRKNKKLTILPGKCWRMVIGMMQ